MEIMCTGTPYRGFESLSLRQVKTCIPIRVYRFLFYIKQREGFERALIKQSCGLFLARSVYERLSYATRREVRDRSSRTDEHTLSALVVADSVHCD